MHRILSLTAPVTGRLRRLLARPEADRGDSPVPSAVIIAGLVLLAFAIVAWVYFIGQDMMNRVDPANMPAPPQGPGGGP